MRRQHTARRSALTCAAAACSSTAKRSHLGMPNLLLLQPGIDLLKLVLEAGQLLQGHVAHLA
jgi:hypothetical protein